VATDDTTAGNAPIFKAVFGDSWDMLAPVMKDHYAVRSNSGDVVRVEGVLDIKISWPVSLMARLSGLLLAYSGKAVPVTVVFSSGARTNCFRFDRTFHFPDRGPVTFRSQMEHIGGNELVEFMGLGIGWKLACSWDGAKVVLAHRGYVWRIFGRMFPVPLALVMGRGHAEEVAISDTEFSMWTHARHPLFGDMFAYSGRFKVTEVSCNRS